MSRRKPAGISPKREPSGRLSRSTEKAIDAAPPAEVKRLRDAALKTMADPLWGSEIGRLLLTGRLSATQFETARRWGSLISQWYRATGAPLPYPPAPGGGYAHADDDPPVTTNAGKALREERLNIIADMTSAANALDEAGPDAVRAVRACCEANEVAVGLVGYDHLRVGLDRLARHWRLAK